MKHFFIILTFKLKFYNVLFLTDFENILYLRYKILEQY